MTGKVNKTMFGKIGKIHIFLLDIHVFSITEVRPIIGNKLEKISITSCNVKNTSIMIHTYLIHLYMPLKC